MRPGVPMLNMTKSPLLKFALFVTGVSTLVCALDPQGIEIPFCLKTSCVKEEQSKIKC